MLPDWRNLKTVAKRVEALEQLNVDTTVVIEDIENPGHYLANGESLTKDEADRRYPHAGNIVIQLAWGEDDPEGDHCDFGA